MTRHLAKMFVVAVLLRGVCIAQSPPSQQQPVRRTATLQQQKMCADQARKSFLETGLSKHSANDITPSDYTSHYDAKANICYVMVHSLQTIDKGVTSLVGDTVWDAFEGRVYASYVWQSQKDKKFWEVAPIMCNVKPLKQPEIICKSTEEFEQLIDKYFGIGR